MQTSWKLLSLAFLALFAFGAHADPIGGPGSTCGSCQGGVYTLTYDGTALPDADPLHETYRVTLTVDTNTYTGGGAAIAATSVKVASAIIFGGSSLFAAPGGLANWSLVDGGIAAAGCSGAGSGFLCADYVGAGAGAAVGGILGWVFDIQVNNGALFTDLLESSIKVEYVNSAGDKVGALVSENITLQVPPPPLLIPEPGTLSLLGLGLVALGLRRRRKT
jgi:hypothetical protein